MEIIIVLFVGIFLGVVFTNAWYNYKIERFLHRLTEQAEDELANIVPASIEVDQDTLFMYHKESKAFLASGKTWDELEESCRSKFPEKRFNVKQSEIDEAKAAVARNKGV